MNEVGLNWFIQSLEPNASSFGINLLHTSLINIIHISVILSLRFFYVKIVNLVLNFLTTFLGVLCDLQRKVSRWFLTGFSSSKKNCFPKRHKIFSSFNRHKRGSIPQLFLSNFSVVVNPKESLLGHSTKLISFCNL